MWTASGGDNYYLLELRGFGDSERPGWGYTIPQLAEDVVAFRDALKIQKAVLVGHSMGSLVAHQTGAISAAFKTIGSPSFKDPISAEFLKSWVSNPNPVPAECSHTHPLGRERHPRLPPTAVGRLSFNCFPLQGIELLYPEQVGRRSLAGR